MARLHMGILLYNLSVIILDYPSLQMPIEQFLVSSEALLSRCFAAQMRLFPNSLPYRQNRTTPQL